MISRRKILMGGGALLTSVVATGSWLDQRRGWGKYNAAVASSRAVLSDQPAMMDLIRYATLAASGHNTQPWTFRVKANGVRLLPDLGRRTPVVDPDDHHLFVSLGCAAENWLLASAARGRPGLLAFHPAGAGSLELTAGGGPPTPPGLFEAIPFRQSTRAVYDGKSVSAEHLKALAEAAALPGIDLVLITQRTKIDSVRDLVLAGNSVQLSDRAFLVELKKWLRFSPRQALETGDGLFAGTSGNPALPSWIGPHLFDLVFRAAVENDKYANQIRSSAGIAVFVSQKNDREHWVQAGRACQRFALKATALGLKLAFLNQPVEVADLRPELSALLGMPGRRPDLVMRFGYGPELPFSARRPVSAVLG